MWMYICKFLKLQFTVEQMINYHQSFCLALSPLLELWHWYIQIKPIKRKYWSVKEINQKIKVTLMKEHSWNQPVTWNKDNPNPLYFETRAQIFSLLTIGLTIKNLGIPRVLWLETWDEAVLSKHFFLWELYFTGCSPFMTLSTSPLFLKAEIASSIASVSPTI